MWLSPRRRLWLLPWMHQQYSTCPSSSTNSTRRATPTQPLPRAPAPHMVAVLALLAMVLLVLIAAAHTQDAATLRATVMAVAMATSQLALQHLPHRPLAAQWRQATARRLASLPPAQRRASPRRSPRARGRAAASHGLARAGCQGRAPSRPAAPCRRRCAPAAPPAAARTAGPPASAPRHARPSHHLAGPLRQRWS